jgi:hypothetical protein
MGVMNLDKKEGVGDRGAGRLSEELMNIPLPWGPVVLIKSSGSEGPWGRKVGPRELREKDPESCCGILGNKFLMEQKEPHFLF